MECPFCGYDAVDEIDALAHLTECKANPEEKWVTYVDVVGPSSVPFKNSDILKEEYDDTRRES